MEKKKPVYNNNNNISSGDCDGTSEDGREDRRKMSREIGRGAQGERSCRRRRRCAGLPAATRRWFHAGPGRIRLRRRRRSHTMASWPGGDAARTSREPANERASARAPPSLRAARGLITNAVAARVAAVSAVIIIIFYPHYVMRYFLVSADFIAVAVIRSVDAKRSTRMLKIA